MISLPTELTWKGFALTQIAREGDVAIYRQRDVGSALKGPHVSYEVIVIQSHGGRTIFGKTYPPAEYYPSTEQWGKAGWTVSCMDDDAKLEAAYIKMREVIKDRKAAATRRAKGET